METYNVSGNSLDHFLSKPGIGHWMRGTAKEDCQGVSRRAGLACNTSKVWGFVTQDWRMRVGNGMAWRADTDGDLMPASEKRVFLLTGTRRSAQESHNHIESPAD